MGGSSSKPEPIGTPLPNFNPDVSKATFSGEYIQNYTNSINKQIADAFKAPEVVATTNWLGNLKFYGIIFAVIAGIVLVILAILAFVDYIRCNLGLPHIMFNISGPCNNYGNPTTPASAPVVGPTGSTGSKSLSATSPSTTVSSSRPMFWNWFYGSSSGNLVSQMFDTTSSASVPSGAVSTSTDGQGAYGIQWWMFVKDWNYGYGKEKTVISRSDATNSAISNPRVTLAPTENNLRVSVSIFPNEEGGGSKTEPAPANNPGSSDDVFVCEVPNIPLQSWMSVSVTVFDRNLDVYINGNLVKSCFLPGVPKPAAGNIDISKDGGFSGHMCDLNHYSKMLTPSDAQAFYSAGTSCMSQTNSSARSGGYSVNFGVFDTKGKQVKEYTF
jgi:hypothetical protein